jgi:hypothetical protein
MTLLRYVEQYTVMTSFVRVLSKVQLFVMLMLLVVRLLGGFSGFGMKIIWVTIHLAGKNPLSRMALNS